MYKINRHKETLTSRERVLRAFAFEKGDRAPIHYMANPTIHAKLSKAFGVKLEDYDGFLDFLGVDFRFLALPYEGSLLFQEVEGLNVNPMYGYYTKWIENADGGYEDFCNFPLQGADSDFIANFPVFDPSGFNYDLVEERVKTLGDKAFCIGGAGYPDIINSTSRVMGMEDTLVNLAIEDEATLSYIDRRCDAELKHLEEILKRTRGRADFMWYGEDLGTQIAPMISMDMYRRVIKPRHMRYIELAKAYDLPVMVHTCGSSSWVYEEFLDMGINAVDTLQPEAVNMSPEYLRDHFGGRLAFHGCISTAGPLAYGTPDEVEQTVKDTMEVLIPTKGYMMSPSHMIQDNTPIENVVRMYQAAHDYGRHSLYDFD